MANKLIGVLEHVRTLWAVLLIFGSAAIWAADQVYARKAYIDNAFAVQEIRQIDDKIFDLAVEITPENKIVNEAKIERYKAKKELLMKEIK